MKGPTQILRSSFVQVAHDLLSFYQGASAREKAAFMMVDIQMFQASVLLYFVVTSVLIDVSLDSDTTMLCSESTPMVNVTLDESCVSSAGMVV